MFKRESQKRYALDKNNSGIAKPYKSKSKGHRVALFPDSQTTHPSVISVQEQLAFYIGLYPTS